MGEHWTITHQAQTDELTPAGRLEPAMRIDFETVNGVSGSVVVPLDNYQADYVKEVIDRRVANILEIGAL